ncbi:magnesium and cobalt transport protein CorA [Subtercola boreus]|uniref:Transporter n=1 Tax=Subtercola boreus TaxID=120213 RepID=A0A3E0W971_9MICO|nr:magnesium and cobalt transport protein CorA [Subtercola boreus]RFA20227.1 transporter [Subtercola boreus]RFA20379.1 transporter [Subtercola boreus]RFA26631.1 transporter [Subtercola boreus]
MKFSQVIKGAVTRRPASHDDAPVEVAPSLHPFGAGGGVIDNAIYSEGKRVLSCATPQQTIEALSSIPDALAWIGLFRPDEAALSELEHEFGLHPLAIEDAVGAHQRPKLERYGDVLFVVLRAAFYVDEREEVEFGELHLFVGPNFVVSVRHSASPDLSIVRRRMEADPKLLALGPIAALYGIMDAVVDQYAPVVAGLETDIDQIEAQVFEGDPEVSRRIYELSQEVLDFQRATLPLTGMLQTLRETYGQGETGNLELKRAFRDVADHVAVVNERVDGFRQTLREILTVNATLVAQRQNEDMKKLAETSNHQNDEVKKISAWAAIFFAPTVVTGIYGMNFDYMPELHFTWSYPAAIGLMVGLSVGLYAMFKKRGWL